MSLLGSFQNDTGVRNTHCRWFCSASFNVILQILSAAARPSSVVRRSRNQYVSRPKPIIRKIVSRQSTSGTAQNEDVPRRLVADADLKHKEIDVLRINDFAHMKVRMREKEWLPSILIFTLLLLMSVSIFHFSSQTTFIHRTQASFDCSCAIWFVSGLL